MADKDVDNATDAREELVEARIVEPGSVEPTAGDGKPAEADSDADGRCPNDHADAAAAECAAEEGAAEDSTLRMIDGSADVEAADEPAESAETAETADEPADEVLDADGDAVAQGPAARDDDDTDADTETIEAPVGMGEPEVTTERVVEAVLFASDAPLPLSKIVSIVGVGSARDIRNHLKALNEKYAQTGASFRIEQIAGGYQMLTTPVYNTWIRRLKQSKQDSKLSQAALETLAVVAYKQPVIRADIEAIRGVSAGEMLNRLREVGLIKIVGRAEDVGRPMLYGTTKRFLEVFGLAGLEDLPPVEEMQPGGQ